MVVVCTGGGWILGDPVVYQQAVVGLVNDTGAGVVFVNYTRAPDAVYPVAIEEAYSALQWLYAHAGEYGMDAKKVAFVGDSAGGAYFITPSFEYADELG